MSDYGDEPLQRGLFVDEGKFVGTTALFEELLFFLDDGAPARGSMKVDLFAGIQTYVVAENRAYGAECNVGNARHDDDNASDGRRERHENLP